MSKSQSKALKGPPKGCVECGSRCCRYLCFQIDTPESYEEFENVRWFLMHKGVSVHIEENGDWYMSISNICLNLGKDNLCKEYGNRPLICRKYTVDSCDFTRGAYEFTAVFKTAEQVEKYARSTLGEKRFDRARAKSLANPAAKKKAAAKKVTK